MKPYEFYKKRRPELFSDSEVIELTKLPREVLAYELSKISTNQKQDEFEILCRKLAEKFISPNLIPQVGPTGGGDGKTDFETYSVSKFISDRWFVPEQGWNSGEKWAFAISSKEDWKGKAKDDIKKIVETKRGYTLVYFMTNQLVSSKKKKDAQDQFKKEFNVEVTILDGGWILEKIYNNDLTDIAVNSLNLSKEFISKEIKLGPNDTRKKKELDEIEKKIENPNRYFKHDFQLVSDAIESALLSRKLERPRGEVEGKFDRAFRFCKKLNNTKQWIRLYYQRAWTYFYYYEDYSLFIDDYKCLKTYISRHSSIYDVELYFNIFNLLISLEFSDCCVLSDYEIVFDDERKKILQLLVEIENKKETPNSALIAHTYKVFLELSYSVLQNKKPDNIFKELSEIIIKSEFFLDFPFEKTKKIIEDYGKLFPDNNEYDNLIIKLAQLSEKRYSEINSGDVFIRRGLQKIQAEYYKESIVFFGKAFMKFAKIETQNRMYMVLHGLGVAYRELGLLWASNNSFLTACSISFKSISVSGTLSKTTIQSIKEIIKNELFLGRVSSFFSWHEMYSLLNQSFGIDKNNENNEKISFTALNDACFSTRILNTYNECIDDLQYLPDMLEKLELFSSQNTVLYKLGYTEEIIEYYEKINNEKELDNFFYQVANQPFVEQMIYQTNFMSENEIQLYSIILGCKFYIKFVKDNEMLLVAETLFAFMEGFFATSINVIIPHVECITMNLKKIENAYNLDFTYNSLTSEYDVFINNNFYIIKDNRKNVHNFLFKFISDIFARHFIAKDSMSIIQNLFIKEEVQERLASVIDHRNITINLFGDRPKLFFKDWINYLKPTKYIFKRETPISYIKDVKNENKLLKKTDIDKIRHDEIKALSVIDVELWDKANWNGFGCLFNPQIGPGIILTYENPNEGKKIFDKWIANFGHEDKDELIKITIIRGVDEKHPYWYRVHISSNIEKSSRDKSNKLFTISSRIREITPNTPHNLNKLLEMFKAMHKYRRYPAKMSDEGNDIVPFIDRGILKTSLNVKEAWEIGEHDLDRLVIKENDSPIIPNAVAKDAPVLKILNRTVNINII